MTDQWICPTSYFDGTAIVSGVSLRIEHGRVLEVSEAPQSGVSLPGCLSAGFVDVQVNGGGGVLLNADPTPQGLATMVAAHARFGTAAILPTVITDRPEVLDQAAEAVKASIHHRAIMGLHIEGPHISRVRRGTHAAEFVRPLDDRTMTVVDGLRAADVPVMITLAPEAASTDQISRLADLGAVVSIGHTDADADVVDAAIAAGARCGTHLFNAMSPMQGRAPGAVGAILNAGVQFGLICDGHHVDYRMIRLALRAAGAPGRAFLVSDAMSTIGGPDAFDLYGRAVHLEDGRLINSEGNLAGAHVTQAEGVRNLVQQVGVPLVDALRMAITVPADLMGQPELSRAIGRDVSDLIVVSDDVQVTRLADHLGGPRGSLDAAE